MSYKLTVYIPQEALSDVKEALFAAGAGRLGSYDRCAWQVLGQGQFRPLPGAQPWIGQTDCDEKVAEWRVEMLVAEEAVTAVIQALYSSHPYEEPAFDLVKLLERSPETFPGVA